LLVFITLYLIKLLEQEVICKNLLKWVTMYF
jgi:hypothetical protein